MYALFYKVGVVRPPLYPIFRFGGNIIWDLTDFDLAHSNELLPNDIILEPKKHDGDYIILCRGNFNIKSLIYENATANGFENRIRPLRTGFAKGYSIEPPNEFIIHHQIRHFRLLNKHLCIHRKQL